MYFAHYTLSYINVSSHNDIYIYIYYRRIPIKAAVIHLTLIRKLIYSRDVNHLNGSFSIIAYYLLIVSVYRHI